jgi:hypothetical protein
MPNTDTLVPIAADALARARAAALLPHVRLGMVGEQAELVDVGYVLAGAVTVGLNRWALPGADRPMPGVFTAQPGTCVEAVEVAVLETDRARALELAHACRARLEDVLSAALCTGLGKLAGEPATVGPFEVIDVA